MFKAMNRMLALALALNPALAFAQQFPVVNDHTVIGRIGTGTGSGPSQAITFSTLNSQLYGPQNANVFFGGPSTAPAALPGFRAIVGSDLPNPSSSTLGGVQSVAAVAHTYMTGISTSGVPTVAIPVCADLSNAAASCSTDTTNASNISSGTLNTARLPSPFTSGTASGNTTKFGTVSGTVTNGHCASYDASGNLIDSGAACGSSAMVLLNTLPASASTTLSDTTSLTSTYSSYEIVFANIVSATNAVTAQLQVHSNSSFPATSYVTSGLDITSASGTAFVVPTTFIPVYETSNVGNTAANGGISGTCKVFNPSQTTAKKHWNCHFSGLDSGGTVYRTVVTGGIWNGGNTAVDGFQFFMSSGSIASGTIKIYGIQ